MPTAYVAKSQSLQTWGADVGLTKHLYKVGVTDATAERAIKALNEAGYAGRKDWTLVRKQEVETLDEATAIERLGRKETAIHPTYYPQIKGAQGIFKVKIANVEDHLMVQRALAGRDPKVTKATPVDIAAYLIRNALG